MEIDLYQLCMLKSKKKMANSYQNCFYWQNNYFKSSILCLCVYICMWLHNKKRYIFWSKKKHILFLKLINCDLYRERENWDFILDNAMELNYPCHVYICLTVMLQNILICNLSSFPLCCQTTRQLSDGGKLEMALPFSPPSPQSPYK